MRAVQKLEQADRHRIAFPIRAQNDLGKDKIRPRGDKRHERGIDDNRLAHRHDDFPKDLPTRRAL